MRRRVAYTDVSNQKIIPKNSVINYETAIKGGKFAVIAHGATEEVVRAKNILHSAGHAGVEVYAGGEKAAKA
jgi:hypothetical protein